jgi:uncharacterized protein YbjT (DUF2867 family)
VALSVVGIERLPGYGYFTAKAAQEKLIAESSRPYSIVRATQFFEFVDRIAASGTEGNIVRLPPVLIQPIAADDVAKAVSDIAVGTAVNGMVEIAGPDTFRLDEFVRQGLSAPLDPREVKADPESRYFGGIATERSLVPGEGARLGEIRFQEWLGRPMAMAGRAEG